MRCTRTLSLLCAIAVVALMLVMAGTAFALPPSAPHVTLGHAGTPTTLQMSLVSTGDAGGLLGNQEWATSPVLPSPPSGFGGWFNQGVAFYSLHLYDPDHDDDMNINGSFYQFSPDNVTWGPHMGFDSSAGMGVNYEGLYSITATGTDGDDPNASATGTVDPAFGIDMTAPTSYSDAVPVYNTPAVVTITATDTLSGVESLEYGVDDGPWDFSWDSHSQAALMVPVTIGPGSHTLWWHAFDNAGNIDSHSVSFIVRPTGFVPSVTLSAKPRGGAEENSHFVKFSGNVSRMATNKTLKVTVQRWNGTAWKYYTAYYTTVAKYVGSYSFTRFISKDGTYRALASEAGGLSSWKKFTTK